MDKSALIRPYLAYLKNLGILEVPLTPGLQRFLSQSSVEVSPLRTLDELKDEIARCQLCSLAQTRRTPIFGEGNPSAKVLVVLDYPRKDEETQGLVSTGSCRTLLHRLLQTISQAPTDFFLTHAVKCRNPNDKSPEGDEISACKVHLLRQIEMIRPKTIICFGTTPIKVFFKESYRLTLNEARRRPLMFRDIPVFFTYHPEDLQRNPQVRRCIWEDLQRAKECLKDA